MAALLSIISLVSKTYLVSDHIFVIMLTSSINRTKLIFLFARYQNGRPFINFRPHLVYDHNFGIMLTSSVNCTKLIFLFAHNQNGRPFTNFQPRYQTYLVSDHYFGVM
jgi:hypothetical protein